MKYLLLLFLLCSCAGYQIDDKQKVFSQWGKSIYIASARQQGAIDGIAAHTTKALQQELSTYPDLEIVGREDNPELVLYTLIVAPNKWRETLRPTSKVVESNIAAANGERRASFYIPGASEIRYKIIFYLFKDVKVAALDKALESQILSQIQENGSLVEKREFTMTQEFSRNIYRSHSGKVNATQNYAIYQGILMEMAKRSVTRLRETLIYEF